MLTPRFFVPPAQAKLSPGSMVELPAAVAHHAVRVLRLAAGARLALFDGLGGEHPASIARVDKRGVLVRVDDHDAVERESPLAVTLAQALIANDAMDYAVRKATELGVAAIQPLRTARSAPLPAGERSDRRLAHWQEVAVAACEQCGRNRIPVVAAPVDLGSWLAASPGPGFVLAPAGGARLGQQLAPAGPLVLLVGPEGGFTGDEVAAAQATRLLPIELGPRVLRAETAGVAALAAMQAAWGDG
jgi:16S rRNA (uracil1498-N3)-methyltransferase